MRAPVIRDFPFSAGPRLSQGPRGDPSTEAIASLRGYAYQLYASGLAWLRLVPGQDLYLEVAKDYAVAAGSALQAVEVKNTASSTITIKSKNVLETLDAYVDLVARNPDRKVQLHFLSTSTIGRERKKADRTQGEATLLYWRRAASGADVAPLRSVLSRVALPERVRTFIDARDDQTLREEFLRCIHWDCGQPELEGLIGELQAGLVRYGAERLGSHGDDRDRLTGAVLQRLLRTVVGSDIRRLTDTDLFSELDSATRLSLSRRDVDLLIRAMSEQLSGAQASAPLDTGHLPRVSEPETDAPLPVIVAERTSLVAHISNLVRECGVAFVSGSTGSGKTLLTRLTARLRGGRWQLIDVRNIGPDLVGQRLELALGALPPDTAGVILDDFNEIEELTACHALGCFLRGLQRRDAPCLITAYCEPSARVISELGLDRSAHVAVPPLTTEEIGTMITAAGGNGTLWRDPVYLASGLGHPQLVQAIISSVRMRGWPDEERKRLRELTPSTDVEAERLAVRRRLVAALPEAARALLYRISLFIGRFDRPMALAVGAIEPTVQAPGAQLDQLVGPWVEQLGQNQLRMSPLLQGTGEAVLAQAEQAAVHRIAAETLVSGSSIDVGKADVAFLHALLGKSEATLMKLAYGVIRSNSEQRRRMSEWITGLRLHRLDRRIYPDRPFLSVTLRFAQFLLVAGQAHLAPTQKCWSVLQNELQQLSDVENRQRLEYLILAKSLLDEGAAGILPKWVDLVIRFSELSKADPERQKRVSESKWDRGTDRRITVLGVILSVQMHGIRGVAELSEAFNRIEELTQAQRDTLFSDMLAEPGDFALIVNHAWLAESKRAQTDWATCAESYRLMADKAHGWGYRELAVRCHVARAIVLDEYVKDSIAGERALDDAIAAVGDDPVLSRARAKILFRRRDHRGALQLLRSAADEPSLSHSTDQAFMLREAAICAAEIQEWSEARQWFSAASAAADRGHVPAMKTMAIGLMADAGLAAFKDGNVALALTGLSGALDRLSALDPASSILAGYCHRVVRHAVLWIFGQGTRQDVDVDGQPAVMLPGMCSNPEPGDLKDMPLASLDFARYLLAQTETQTGAAAGIASGLRAALGDRAIPAMEIGLRHARVGRAIQTVDAEGLMSHLPAWVDSQVYLKVNGADLRAQGPLSPVYGEIATSTFEQLQSPIAIFATEDAILSFGIVAALECRFDALTLVDTSCAQGGAVCRELATTMATGESRGNQDRMIVAKQVYAVVRASELTPEELYVAGVRFVQAAVASNFKAVLAPALARWARERWTYACEQQRFYMRSPGASVPAIKKAIASSDSGLAFVGRLLVAIEPAVRSQLDSKTREFLLSL